MQVYLNSPMAVDATRIYSHHAGKHRLSKQASGMATGGRVLHHLKACAPNPRCTILFTGHQAAGTRGATLVGGAKTVKIFGEYVPVRAEVANLDMLSAHADRDDLLDWMTAMPKPPSKVYITHGEPVAADALRLAIQDRLGWPCEVPAYRQSVKV